jgi:hypothetical protein
MDGASSARWCGRRLFALWVFRLNERLARGSFRATFAATTMDIDSAFEAFKRIRAALPASDDERSIADNEACTRVHLIDPILRDVLGWSVEHTLVEVPGGDTDVSTGAREGRVDYVIRDANLRSWFVIEAKKRSQPVVDATATSRGVEQLKLNGPVLNPRCWNIVSRQMSAYLGRHVPAYGAITTGEQWVGFLCKFRPDSMLLEQCEAVVFRSLDAIAQDFEAFVDCFGAEGAARRELVWRLHPDAARGLVRATDARRVVRAGDEKPLAYQGTEEFYEDIRHAMQAAFRPIHNDHRAVLNCFVESRESELANSRLERLASELGQQLSPADRDYEPMVVREVEGTASSDTPREDLEAGNGVIARIVGEKSAGKSVFLLRLFERTLAQKRGQFIKLWLDVEQFSPFDADSADRALLESLVRSLFGEDGPSWEQLREVYRREWSQRLRLAGLSDTQVSAETREHFSREMIAAESARPHEALVRYAQYATKNQRKLPCIVVDNIDHASDVAAVIGWAIALHKSVFALTTIALEDSTLWRLRGADRDQLGDMRPEQFWLHRPKVREVLQKRCEYLRDTILASAKPTGDTRTRVGTARQYRWRVDPDVVGRTVSAVLLDDERTAQWIGELCNYDLRETLEVCEQIVLSPHVKASQLLTAQATNSAIPRHKILRALIAPRSEQFLGLPTDRVCNVLAHWIEQDLAPLLPARLLAVLRARDDDDKGRGNPFAGFVGLEGLAEQIEDAIGVPRSAVVTTLRDLATRRLVEPFNPADRGLVEPEAKVRLSPRGRLHLEWALVERTYVRLVAEVDPIADAAAHRELSGLRSEFLAAIDPRAPRDRSEVRRLELDFVCTYVGYLRARAPAVASRASDWAATAILGFDEALARQWQVTVATG